MMHNGRVSDCAYRPVGVAGGVLFGRMPSRDDLLTLPPKSRSDDPFVNDGMDADERRFSGFVGLDDPRAASPGPETGKQGPVAGGRGEVATA